VSNGNFRIKTQSDNAKKILIHGETKEKPTDFSFDNLSEDTKVTKEGIEVNIFFFSRNRSSRMM